MKKLMKVLLHEGQIASKYIIKANYILLLVRKDLLEKVFGKIYSFIKNHTNHFETQLFIFHIEFE